MSIGTSIETRAGPTGPVKTFGMLHERFPGSNAEAFYDAGADILHAGRDGGRIINIASLQSAPAFQNGLVASHKWIDVRPHDDGPQAFADIHNGAAPPKIVLATG